MLNEDNTGYFKYTGPARLDKAVHTLAGILKGIAADQEVTQKEMWILGGWVSEHRDLTNRHPFNEVVPLLWKAVEDRRFEQDELDELIWLCERLSTQDGFYDSFTTDIQELHGYMAGVAFDGQINVKELNGLREWLDRHVHLRTIWPFDEVDSLITSVLADGKIDADEHRELMAFFAEFAKSAGHSSVSLNESLGLTARGVCVVDPQIEFHRRVSCFTGKSSKASRKELAALIADKGGIFKDSVVRELDYLIVGADGNPCWAYSCYGRKIEQVIDLRKNGFPILLVHEYDFWDFT